jgi:UDP-N-acetylglucosamine/UDP-N-acetylgalactosamine 4-epimerase
VLDDLSKDFFDNVKDIGLLNFEFIQGDIHDLETCIRALNGKNFISHQAALGSVPRSLAKPIFSNEANFNGL